MLEVLPRLFCYMYTTKWVGGLMLSWIAYSSLVEYAIEYDQRQKKCQKIGFSLKTFFYKNNKSHIIQKFENILESGAAWSSLHTPLQTYSTGYKRNQEKTNGDYSWPGLNCYGFTGHYMVCATKLSNVIKTTMCYSSNI